MAKYNKTLRFRDDKKALVFHGKFGNENTGVFDYTDKSNKKTFGEFTEEEILAFYVCHNKATIDGLMIGESPKAKVLEISKAPEADKAK